MRLLCRKNGFSLVEILVVIAAVAVLVSMVVGVGKHVKEQGKIKLTESTIEILVTAVELYYQDNGEMPFETTMAVDVGFSDLDFDVWLYNQLPPIPPPPPYAPHMMLDPDPLVVRADWSSEALYYYLNKSQDSRRIINTITNTLISAKDDTGSRQVMAFIDGSAAYVDMPRFVDAWGNTLRYRYTAGDSFCVISSPGKDKLYGTADDITNLN